MTTTDRAGGVGPDTLPTLRRLLNAVMEASKASAVGWNLSVDSAQREFLQAAIPQLPALLDRLEQVEQALRDLQRLVDDSREDRDTAFGESDFYRAVVKLTRELNSGGTVAARPVPPTDEAK